jgi:3-oxoacyl-[acyl-carrier-protein] synthase-1
MESLFLYATSAFTCVGLSARETASSVRANITNYREDDCWLEGTNHSLVFGAVPNEGILLLSESLQKERGITARVARMLQLSGTALINDITPLSVRPALFLALPEHKSGSEIIPETFLNRLSLQTEEKFFNPSLSRADFKGRAGGLKALVEASKYIEENPSLLVLVGGVDTFDDPVLLNRLDREERIKHKKNLDGFIPGEGAGFLLVGSEEAGKKNKLTPIAQVAVPALGFETGHLYSSEAYRGEGLDEAIKTLFKNTPPETPIHNVYCTMNGESHWIKEWGVTRVRNSASFVEEEKIFHPAENFGDIGAAFGPVLIALAAIGTKKGYRQAPILVYTSSDYGDRSATLVNSKLDSSGITTDYTDGNG